MLEVVIYQKTCFNVSDVDAQLLSGEMCIDAYICSINMRHEGLAGGLPSIKKTPVFRTASQVTF